MRKTQNSGRKRRKSNTLLNIAIVLAALGSILLALYPTIANAINQLTQNQNIVVYNEVVHDIDTSELDAMWAQAQEFNETVEASGRLLYEFSDEQETTYNSLLNVNNDGILGYVDIDSLNIHLPVYHGTEDEVLEKAVGHLEGTSLPVDGSGVFSMITGHTGLPNLDLFTDIRKMEVGDTFTMTVLNRVLHYTVDQIDVVLPEEMYDLSLIEDANYCTLVTCTPYGVNDHRLLVRGALTDVEITGTTETEQVSYVYSDHYKFVDQLILILATILIVIAIIILIAIALMFYRMSRKNRRE